MFIFLCLLLILSMSLLNIQKADAASLSTGIAIKNPTIVYANQSKDSKPLKSYKAGTILKYQISNNGWHQATVYINGVATKGYIHASDVDTATSALVSLKGIAIGKPTAVYSSASTDSNILKSYNQGHILLYRTFSTEWYQASVYIKGKKKTGYIQKSDLETAFESQKSLRGVSLKNPTAVFKNGSTSAAWKSYPAGSILQYKSFSPNWHQTSVYVNGKKKTGYINRSHVENVLDAQRVLSGIGTVQPTSVYSRASVTSKALKTYPAGKKLVYKTFSSDWYETSVYIGGKKITGYININHTEQLIDPQDFNGRTTVASTVYKLASKSSGILQSLPKGNQLKLKSYTKNWFQTTIVKDGKIYTGYIPASDVSTKDVINSRNYNYTFDEMVKKQLDGSPKSDGAGKINATKEQVEFYANPLNFPQGSNGFYQFLNLKASAGLSASEMNTQILAGKGILEGLGGAFVKASASAGINEAYLLAHTLHETGNGTSVLAKGIPVDKAGNVTRDKDGKIAKTAGTVETIYNMYGYGAKDACPIDCGAKYAFEQGWFTPSEAIIGGAQQVGINYINRGQDTLYKMRWNPDRPGTHQYATHVKWAEIQTGRIASIYDKLNNYVLEFEVPKFLNQPGPTTRPTDPTSNGGTSSGTTTFTSFPKKAFGLTTDHVNLRKEPSTTGAKISTIPKSTKIEVLGVNSTWYKVKAGSSEGWMHSDYVKLLNLLETKTTVNIRPEASTTKDRIGTASTGSLLSAVLDKDNKMVRKNEWYQIHYQTGTAWISGGTGGTQYILVK